MTEEEIEAAELFETIMISPYLVEISAALSGQRLRPRMPMSLYPTPTPTTPTSLACMPTK